MYSFSFYYKNEVSVAIMFLVLQTKIPFTLIDLYAEKYSLITDIDMFMSCHARIHN